MTQEWYTRSGAGFLINGLLNLGMGKTMVVKAISELKSTTSLNILFPETRAIPCNTNILQDISQKEYCSVSHLQYISCTLRGDPGFPMTYITIDGTKYTYCWFKLGVNIRFFFFPLRLNKCHSFFSARPYNISRTSNMKLACHEWLCLSNRGFVVNLLRYTIVQLQNNYAYLTPFCRYCFKKRKSWILLQTTQNPIISYLQFRI